MIRGDSVLWWTGMNANDREAERPLGLRTVLAQADHVESVRLVDWFAKRIDIRIANVGIHWRFSENVCELPRSEASPKARKRGDAGRVVEIGGIDSLGVQQDVSYGLLLNLLPDLPTGAERRPSKQRKVARGRRARV